MISFKAENLYSFDTKAMESGTVRIWAGSPIDASSTYTIDGASLTGGTLLWGVSQAGTTTSSDFFSVYPSAAGETFAHGTTGFDYEITGADDAAYRTKTSEAIDLTVAAKKAAPGTAETPATVALSYTHPFAKIVYVITNSSDDSIEKATISGVYHHGIFDYSESAGVLSTTTSTGEYTTVSDKAMVQSNASNVYTFSTVSVPHTSVNPQIKIYMHSGAYYTFSLTAAQDLAAGMLYTASITIDHTQQTSSVSRTVTCSFTETDWPDSDHDTDVTFDTSGDTYTDATSWPCIKGRNIKVGTDLSGNFERSFPMTCVGANSYKIVIQKQNNDNNFEFKVYVSGTDTWYGRATSSTNATTDGDWKYYTLSSPGSDIVWSDHVDGKITLYYYKDSGTLYVRTGEQTR